MLLVNNTERITSCFSACRILSHRTSHFTGWVCLPESSVEKVLSTISYGMEMDSYVLNLGLCPDGSGTKTKSYKPVS
jgi:hypothetical protein